MELLLKCKTLIDGVHKLPTFNKIIKIENNYITQVEDFNDFRCSDDVFDLGELTVMPGIVDCHDHLGLDVGDEKAQSFEQDVYIAIKGVKIAQMMLESGITTLRDVGEKAFIDVSWRRAINEGIITGPNVLISGQPIVRTGGHAWFLGIEIDGAAEALKAVRLQLKNGANLIKLMVGGGMTTEHSDPLNPEMTRKEVFAIVSESHRAGKKVAAHVHGGDGATLAIEANVDSIEHGVYLSHDQLADMARKSIFLVVTYGVLEAIIRDKNSPKFVQEKVSKGLDNYIRVISMAKELGVQVVIGGDTYHARPSEELKALIKAGFSPMEAIKSATINGAKLCGIESITGSIERGKLADLIAIEGDPMRNIDSIRNVRYVFKKGKIVKRP